MSTEIETEGPEIGLTGLYHSESVKGQIRIEFNSCTIIYSP